MEHRQAFSSPMRGGRSIVVALRFFRSFFSGVEVAPSSLEVYPRGQPLVFADPPVNAYRPIALPDETMNFRMAGNCYCAVAATLKPASKNRMYANYVYIAPGISRVYILQVDKLFLRFWNPEYERIFDDRELRNRLNRYRLIKSWICWYLFVGRRIVKNILNLHRVERRIRNF